MPRGAGLARGAASAGRSSARATVARPVVRRLGDAGTAVVCLVLGLAIAAHYPLGAAAACAAVVAVAAGTFAWPAAWLGLLPAALPVIGFAPWSGWISVEEADFAVLALAAGGYARRAWMPTVGAAVPLAAGTWLLAGLYAAALGVSLSRGLDDAGGFDVGWFQGYAGPMNSLRLAKPFALALLLWPLWREAQRRDPDGATRRWTTGLCLGLAAVSLAALWERLAFTGLLDFSSDYRTTALFWEMHVGGSALDAFLALAVPFAVRELAVTTATGRWLVAAAVLLLASYACLTTFSRGVFLAVPIGLAVTGLLAWRQRRDRPAAAVDRGAFVEMGVLAAAYVVAAAWLFPVAGYRGLLAVLGAFAVLVRRPAAGLDRRGVAVGALAGGVLAGVVAAMAVGWGKGAYLAYALAFAFTGAMLGAPGIAWAAWAGDVALVAALGAVCAHWGGDAALARAWPVIGLLLAAGVLRRGARPAATANWRRHGALVAALVVLGGEVGVMSGGAFMASRLSTAHEDLQVRIDHWKEGIATLSTAGRRAFGVGLGRYPATYALQHADTDAPGDYALRETPDGPSLALAGGRHMIGWGELLRVSQRVAPPRGTAVVDLEVRAPQAAELHLEVCEKHLLYSNACLLAVVAQPATAGAWVPLHVALEGSPVSRGPAYAPRLLVFSIGNGTRDAVIEVRRLHLTDADGADLLANGDFSQGLAHWLFTSDHNLLPWHLENLFVHVLFEQGGVGLALLVAMLLAAAWRLSIGNARGHPLAPAIGGALVGFLIVGQFDSLLDAPRVGLLFYLMLLQALSLRGTRPA